VGPFSNSADRGEFDPVIVRTDYSDEQAWQSIRSTLAETAEKGSSSWIVDDLAWSGASADQVLAAVAATDSFRDDLPVVFIADGAAMQARHHALLAVTTESREDFDDEREYETAMEFGREFRAVPHVVHSIHGNLTLSSMDFEEFSAVAHGDREGIYRCCCRSF
jgi:hypothetical protein